MRVNEQGRSMIEMLGVLAIMERMSVGGIAGYSKAMAKFKPIKLLTRLTRFPQTLEPCILRRETMVV